MKSKARTEGLQDGFNDHVFRTTFFGWISAVVNQPGEGWAPLGCKSALDTHDHENQFESHTGSVAARVNNDCASRRTPGRGC